MTDDDRAFFRDEIATDNDEKTRREKLYHIRERIDNLAEDIEVLRDAGEDETIQYLYTTVGRYERLEQKLRDLEQQLDDLK